MNGITSIKRHEMKIGLFEVGSYGHPTLTECLVRTLETDPSNQITLITKKELYDSSQLYLKNIEVKYVNDSDFSNDLMPFISDKNFDLGLYVTFEDPAFFDFILNPQFKFKKLLFVHNIGFWKDSIVKKAFDKLKFLVKKPSSFFETFIQLIEIPSTSIKIKKVLNSISDSKGKLLTISDELKVELESQMPSVPCFSFPFSYFAIDNYAPKIKNKIRVVIPGYITQLRRDYIGLLDFLLSKDPQVLENIIFDFLGGVGASPDKSAHEIVEKIEKCRSKGLNIVFSQKPTVDITEFDSRLGQADFVLSNLNMKLKYGKNKESGIPFTMIKFAIPGLVLFNNPTLRSVSSSTIIIHDYQELVEKALYFLSKPDKLNAIKTQALSNSNAYLPANIYTKFRKDIGLLSVLLFSFAFSLH